MTTFDEHKANYTFQYGGILFIMLNNSGTGCVTLEVCDARGQWLRSILETSSVPKRICCHVPLISVRDPSVLAESFGFISYYTLEPEEELELIPCGCTNLRITELPVAAGKKNSAEY